MKLILKTNGPIVAKQSRPGSAFHGNVQKNLKDNKATADKNKPDINLEHPMEPDVDVNEALVDITRIFSFSSLEKLVEMCGHLRNFYNGPNTAYRSTSSGKYYIILHRGIYDLARFARAEAVAAEYGTPCPNNHAAPQFLAEHCEVLICRPRCSSSWHPLNDGYKHQKPLLN